MVAYTFDPSCPGSLRPAWSNRASLKTARRTEKSCLEKTRREGGWCVPLMKKVHSGPESDLSWFSSEEEG